MANNRENDPNQHLLAQARKEAGLTPTGAAFLVNVAVPTWRRYESLAKPMPIGRRCMFDLRVRALANGRPLLDGDLVDRLLELRKEDRTGKYFLLPNGKPSRAPTSDFTIAHNESGIFTRQRRA